MKQVVQNYKTGELKIDEVPSPTLVPLGILVENRCSLISAGTEKTTVEMAKKSLMGKAQARPDLVKKVITQVKKEGLLDTAKMVLGRLDTRAALGYTCAGVVAEVASGVEGFVKGDRVACAGQNYASHAEVVSIPKNLAVRIPEGVDYEDAAYVAVGAIALQGVRQADPKLGEVVVVIGLGLLGQLVVQMLKANGCKVVGSDLDPEKLELAKVLGADMVVAGGDLVDACAKATNGHGVDAVIITASTESSAPIAAAGEICRKKGRVVVVGAVGMEIPREPYYLRELELRLSCSYGPGRYDSDYEEKGQDYPYGYVRWTEQRNMAAFLDLIVEGKINLKALTTHRFGIAEADKAYQLITDQAESYLGIVLQYAPGSPGRFRQRYDLGKKSGTKTIEVGLIGAGNHIKDMLLPCFRKNAQTNIRAVCTSTGINAKAVAEKEGAEYCASNYQEIMQDKNINTVVIGTRHNTHAAVVIEALRNGKHVFVEKPLCLTADELQEIEAVYAASASQGLVLQVGFNRRYSTHAEKIKSFFASRANPLTMIYRLNAGSIDARHWIQDQSVGGGRIVGEACHFIDFMQFVAGSDPTSIHAIAVGSHNSGITDDKAILTISFVDGSIGTVIYCADGDKALEKERFEAFADGKSVVMNDFLRTEFYAKSKMTTYKTSSRDKGFRSEVESFIASITNGGVTDELFFQAKKTTLVTLKAIESMKSRAVISI